jgi:PAS domain S-box-containing protein
LPHVLLPIGYGVPVVIVSVFRNRRLLWATVAAFAVLTIIKFTMFFPAGPAPQVVSSERWLISLILIDLLIVGALADVWISTQERLQHRNRDLETANSELAAREEEIARQNEELQSQTEELERQSEELRLSNDELLRREKTLEVLLSLSRSLTTELSRGDMMTRICETLSLVVDGTSAASAILEQDGDLLRVRCHHGFGPKGIAREILPTNQSFASLVLSRGRTGYLEDIGLRPDLKIVQPAEGPLMVGVLAVPLRVGAWPIGTLEIFSRQKTRWTDEQIALVESLAAQTSVSLEAAQLFESVQIERHRFETVLRTVPLALVTANADATDIRVNPAAAVLFNVPADVNVASEIGRGSAQLFRDGRELPPGEDLILQAVRNGREVQREELELLNPGGKRVFVLGNARPIRDDQGKINGAVAAYVDITPLKELQRELDLRRREAEEASVRKTRFLAAVSHDIRTPANAISLLAELVRRTAANPAMAGEIPELARELHISSISLVNLLSDVLDIARFDSGKVELQESEFSLVSLLEEEHRQMSPLARERKLTFSFVRPAQPVWVRADRIKLGRILGNLVGNAIKFTEAGEIRLEGELSADGAVRIRVIDTGIGIAPEHLRHIFDEFFQLRNPERDRNKGTGLGLTICKRLVDAMGGALEVQSDVERGSVFTVLLPSSVIVPLGHSSVSKSREETDAAGNGGSLAQSDLC